MRRRRRDDDDDDHGDDEGMFVGRNQVASLLRESIALGGNWLHSKLLLCQAGGHSFSTYARRGEWGQANAYECVEEGEGLTHEVRTQSKNLSAFCIHPAIFSFAKVPSQTFN